MKILDKVKPSTTKQELGPMASKEKERWANLQSEIMDLRSQRNALSNRLGEMGYKVQSIDLAKQKLKAARSAFVRETISEDEYNLERKSHSEAVEALKDNREICSLLEMEIEEVDHQLKEKRTLEARRTIDLRQAHLKDLCAEIDMEKLLRAWYCGVSLSMEPEGFLHSIAGGFMLELSMKYHSAEQELLGLS